MPDRDLTAHERAAGQIESSAGRLREIAKEAGKDGAQEAFESVGVDISSYAGRERYREGMAYVLELREKRERNRELLAWVEAKKKAEEDRGAQVRSNLIAQLFGLAKALVVGIGLALGAYFGITGKGPHP